MPAGSSSVTGLICARRFAPPSTRFVLGESDCFDSRSNVIVLTAETAIGVDRKSLLHAAHEAAHARQRQEFPWAFSWWGQKLTFLRRAIERDAWEMAEEFLQSLLPPAPCSDAYDR